MTERAKLRALRKRLDAACLKLASVLDDGERDPTWSESQELEAAAIELGRALRKPPTDPGGKR